MKIPYKTEAVKDGYLIHFNFKVKPFKVTTDMIDSFESCKGIGSRYEAEKAALSAGISSIMWEMLDRNRGLGFRNFHERFTDLLIAVDEADTKEKRIKAIRDIRNHVDKFCLDVEFDYD